MCMFADMCPALRRAHEAEDEALALTLILTLTTLTAGHTRRRTKPERPAPPCGRTWP